MFLWCFVDSQRCVFWEIRIEPPARFARPCPSLENGDTLCRGLAYESKAANLANLARVGAWLDASTPHEATNETSRESDVLLLLPWPSSLSSLCLFLPLLLFVLKDIYSTSDLTPQAYFNKGPRRTTTSIYSGRVIKRPSSVPARPKLSEGIADRTGRPSRFAMPRDLTMEDKSPQLVASPKETEHRDVPEEQSIVMHPNPPKDDPKSLTNLYPSTRLLTISDLESCVALEDAAFESPQERCTREKVCPLNFIDSPYPTSHALSRDDHFCSTPTVLTGYEILNLCFDA